MIIQINESFPRNVLSLVLAENPVARRENVRQHDEIIDALAAGDGATAREAMRRHVLDSGEQLARWYEERSTTVLTAVDPSSRDGAMKSRSGRAAPATRSDSASPDRGGELEAVPGAGRGREHLRRPGQRADDEALVAASPRTGR